MYRNIKYLHTNSVGVGTCSGGGQWFGFRKLCHCSNSSILYLFISFLYLSQWRSIYKFYVIGFNSCEASEC